MPVRKWMSLFATWGYLFLALALLSNCTLHKDSDGKISSTIRGPQDSGTGYGGSPPRSLIVRCGAQGQSGANSYQIVCGLFDSTPDGKEIPLETLAEGESVTWLAPATLVGASPTSTACTESNHGVTQTCHITTVSADPVTLKFDVSVASNGKVEVLSDSVMLPFVVQTFGFNPKSARNFTAGTEQAIPRLEPLILDPLQVRLQRSQLCSLSQSVFIADNDAVYLWSQGGMQVFAGSIWKPVRLTSAADWKDRYKLPFKSRVAIDCRQGPNGPGDFTLYILSATPTAQGSLTDLMATTITRAGTKTVRIPTTRPWNSPSLSSLRVGADGQWYFTDTLGVSILRLNPFQPSSPPSRYAGTDQAGDTVEAATRLSTSFRNVQDLAFSPAGELYAADMLQQKIFRIDKQGLVRTAMGSGIVGLNVVENNPLSTQLYFPTALTFAENDLYVADSATARILVLHTTTQNVSAIGGIGKPAQDINAKSSQSIAVRSDGSIWVTYAQDTGTYFSRVGRIEAALGSPSTLTSFAWVAGISKQAADNLFTNAATADPTLQKQIFTFLSDAVVDPRDGSVVLTESGNYRILRATFSPSGKIILSPVAGIPFTAPLGTAPDSPDGTPGAQAMIHTPMGVAVGSDGTIYFTESTPRMVKKIDPSGKLQTVADLTGVPADESPPTPTHILHGIAILSERTEIASSDGTVQVLSLPTLAVADDESQQVLKLAPTSAAGNYVASPLMNVVTLSSVLPRGYQPSVQAFVPNLLKTDAAGRLYVGSNLGIYRLSPDGTVHRIAGGGASPDPRYAGPALGTDINPRGMFATRDGSLYVSDNSFSRLIRLDDRGAETPSYDVSLIAMGNDSIRNCGNGTIVGQDDSANLTARLSTSLAQICLGMPQALVVVDRCQSPQRDFTLLFSSSVSINSSNSVLVRATRACP